MKIVAFPVFHRIAPQRAANGEGKPCLWNMDWFKVK